MNINRRGFLFGSAAAATFAGCSTAKVGRRELKPGEKLNVAMIGVGLQGRGNMGKFLANDRVTVVAVCDVDKERLADAKRRVDAQ